METNKAALLNVLDALVAHYRLDEHPFISRFATGDFSQEAIRWWAIKMLPGSNRFNQAFLQVTARIEDYRARTLMLRNIYTEHGELNADLAHVALFMRFMRGIGCSRIDAREDGAFTVPELRFKRFETQDNEPLLWSLGRFAAIEAVLPSIFVRYLEGLKKIFPDADDRTLEYFHVHCQLDPTHTDELLEVANWCAHSDDDLTTFRDGASDMLISISDMFSWMNRNVEEEAGAGKLLRSSEADAREKTLMVADRTLYGEDADLYDSIYY